MHNLHFCVVAADSAEAAERAVEAEIENWGDENNWHSICGSVSENDEVHVTGDGRYPPDAETDTIQKINDFMQMRVTDDNWGSAADALAVMARVVKGDMPENLGGWLVIKQYAERMFNAQIHSVGRFAPGNRTFDVLTDQYMNGDYDDFGVTNMVAPGPWDGEDAMELCRLNPERKRYVVFVDMHS